MVPKIESADEPGLAFGVRHGHRAVSKSTAKQLGVKYEPTGVPGTVLVRTTEYWVGSPIDDEWIGAFQFVVQNGQPVIAELRIIPLQELHQNNYAQYDGLWSGHALGCIATVPPGGLTARLLRQVKLGVPAEFMGSIADHFRKAVKTWKREREGKAELMVSFPDPFLAGLATRVEKRGKRKSRRGKPDLFYAKVARDYVGLVNSGERRPNAVLAKRLRVDRPKVRDIIHRARQRGLLSVFEPGRPGGELTPLALAILRESAKDLKQKGGKRGRKRATKKR